MRRVAALLLAAMLAVGVGGGCGGDESEEPRPPPATPDPTAKKPRFELPSMAALEPGVVQSVREAHANAVEQDDAWAWTAYGHTLFILEFREEAERVLTYARDLPGADPFATSYIAGLAAAVFSHEATAAHLRRAIDARPGYAPAYVRLGKVLEDLGDAKGAEVAYRTAVELEPTSHALLGLARVELGAGHHDQAVTLLEDARRMDPEHAEVLVTLSQAYRRAKNLDASREAAKAIPKRHRKSGIPDLYLGRISSGEREYNSMLEEAHLHRDAGDFRVALKILGDAIELCPDAHEAFATRGDVLTDVGRHEDAYDDYLRAIAIEPRHAAAKSRAGLSLAYVGKMKEAEALLREAIDDDPARDTSHYHLALFFAQSDPVQALEILAFVLDRVPTHVDSRLLRAGIHADAGRDAAAVAEIETVLRQVPSHERAREMLAVMQEKR